MACLNTSGLKKCILHISGEGSKVKPSVRNLGFEGQGDDDDKPITLRANALGLTILRKVTTLSKNGYVKKRNLSTCTLL